MSFDTSEEPAAEARRRARAERRVAQEKHLRKQLDRLDEHLEEERGRWDREVELRHRDEDRTAPPGWTGKIAFGPETTPEVRRAIDGE